MQHPSKHPDHSFKQCSLDEHGEERSGITLFEVVLALAIFLGAMAVIGQVLQNGARAATKAQLTSEAALRCERRMNEVLSGVLPLSPVQGAAFEDDANWKWTVNILDTSLISLLEIQVGVEHFNSRGFSTTKLQLTRLLRDPQIYEDAALLEEETL